MEHHAELCPPLAAALRASHEFLMQDELCDVCGASWECEHIPDPDRADLTYVPPDGTKLGDTYDGQVLAARLDRDPEIQPPYADWAPDLAALAPQMTAMARKMNEVMNELCKIMEPVAKAIEDLSELFAEALDNNQEDVEK